MKLIVFLLALLSFETIAGQKRYIDILTTAIDNSLTNFVYMDFPKRHRDEWHVDNSVEGRFRCGIIINGYKDGKWLTGNASFNKNGYVVAKGKISKEEYFKNGLRHGVFKQFDKNGKVIYQTTFKHGTGLWKAFHDNGNLYFEIYTKDGYFTDTLRLHDDKGRIIGKLLYVKDSLVYSSGKTAFPDYRFKIRY